MALQSRLQELLDESGIKPAGLARAIGCSRASVTDWLNGKTPRMGARFLFATAQHFGVNERWLNSGIGPKYKASGYISNLDQSAKTPHYFSEQVNGTITADNDNPDDSLTKRSNFGPGLSRSIYVQSYELWSGVATEEVRGMTIPSSVLEARGLVPNDVVSIVIPDDAQGPRILKGDFACIAKRHDKGAPLKNDKLYAVKVGDDHTLRLISIQSNGDIRLVCANPNYRHAEEHVPKDLINQLDILGEYIYGGMPAP